MTIQSKIQKLIETRLMASHCLEKTVEEYAANLAADVNRAGLPAQLKFLKEQCKVRAKSVLQRIDEETRYDDADKHLIMLVTFHPQKWNNGKFRDRDAVAAEPMGKTTFEVSRIDVRDLVSRSPSADVLKKHRKAPEWIKNWKGPFEISFEAVIK